MAQLVSGVPEVSLSAAPLGSPCLLPAEALPHATATASPGRWGLGLEEGLQPLVGPVSSRVKLEHPSAAFVGDTALQGAAENCVSLIHGQTSAWRPLWQGLLSQTA